VTLHDLRRNTYADLFDDDLHTVAVTLDGRYSSENVANGYIRGWEQTQKPHLPA
jgi:hypothetical protein